MLSQNDISVILLDLFIFLVLGFILYVIFKKPKTNTPLDIQKIGKRIKVSNWIFFLLSLPYALFAFTVLIFADDPKMVTMVYVLGPIALGMPIWSLACWILSDMLFKKGKIQPARITNNIPIILMALTFLATYLF